MPPEFQFVLSTTGISSINQGIFFGPQNIDWQSPVSSTMSMPGFSWHLYAQPDDGWPNYPASPWLLRSILALTTLTIIAGTLWITALIIHDRKMQRRFWGGLFDLAPFGIALYDAIDGELLQANPPSFTRILGSKGGVALSYFNAIYDSSGKPKKTRSTAYLQHWQPTSVSVALKAFSLSETTPLSLLCSTVCAWTFRATNPSSGSSLRTSPNEKRRND